MALRKKRAATGSRPVSPKRKSGGVNRGRTARPKAQAASAHVVVPGSARPRTKGATRIKDAPSGSNVKVTITLRGPKLPGAHRLAGRTLSAKQFTTSYGAS